MDEKSAPTVLDLPSKQLEDLFREEKRKTRSKKHLLDLAQRAHQNIGFPANGISGETATDYLEQLIPAFTQEVILQVQGGYSSARWLWYLRRLPDWLFSGTYNTTAAYDRTLAESISWHSKKAEQSISSKHFAFRVDSSACHHLANLIAAVKLLSSHHSVYRRIGKGASLYFEGVIPFATQNDEIAEAISTYDHRVDCLQELSLASLGLAGRSWNSVEKNVSLEDRASHLYLFNPCEPTYLPIQTPLPNGESVEANVLARHSFTSVPVEVFLRPYAGLTTQKLPFQKSIEPLIVLQMLLPVLFAELPNALSNVLKFGYCVVSPTRLNNVFNSWLASLTTYLRDIAPLIDWSRSYQEWRGRCHDLVPSLWPLKSGGFIRESNNAILLDVTASSRALLSRISVDRSDLSLTDFRGPTFEIQVQNIVDNSCWKPDNKLSPFCGHIIRRDKHDITNIDAIGEKNGVLLLISCKSVIYDDEYDKGTYRVVANIQSRIDSAVIKWIEIIDSLREKPIGDNFDFSRYSEIIGVVCTPFAVYTKNRGTLSFVKPGLRRCTAAFELSKWLENEYDTTLD